MFAREPRGQRGAPPRNQTKPAADRTPLHDALLRLQRLAGNHAVATLLQRSPTDDTEGARTAGAAKLPGSSVSGHAARELDASARITQQLGIARQETGQERQDALGVIVRVLLGADQAQVEAATASMTTAEGEALAGAATASGGTGEAVVAAHLQLIITQRQTGQVSPPGARTASSLVKPAPARDEKARRLGAASYADYAAHMLTGGGAVFGTTIPAANPVHPVFLDHLERASQLAERTTGRRSWGLGPVAGAGVSGGNHNWGTAIDIDSAANPYIMNEGDDRFSGQTQVDDDTAPVYDRIAHAMLGRASTITPSRPGSVTGLAHATWTDLAEESDAMRAYFSALTSEDLVTPSTLAGLETPRAAASKCTKTYTPRRREGDDPLVGQLTGRHFDANVVSALDHATVQADRDILLGVGRKRPRLFDKDGTLRKTADYPFAANSTLGGRTDSTRQDPIFGFLTIPEPVVRALRDASGGGMRWGATDFSGESGDVMHFDHNVEQEQSPFQLYVAYGRDHPTAARLAESPSADQSAAP